MADPKTVIIYGDQGCSLPMDKMEVEFPPNSHKSKEPPKKEETQKRITKVISGNVKKKKKSLGKRLAETFIGEDVDDVFSYILMEVLIPAAKATISDMVSGGIEMLLFGERRGGTRLHGNQNRTYVSYGNYYKSDNNQRRDTTQQTKKRTTPDELVFETRAEAQDALNHMVDLIADYDAVSVADFYQLVGISGEFPDNSYGWTNLSSARVVPVRGGGYAIDLPRPVHID